MRGVFSDCRFAVEYLIAEGQGGRSGQGERYPPRGDDGVAPTGKLVATKERASTKDRLRGAAFDEVDVFLNL
jgi:hypothetical protein